jgi:drug/metabolite transporter (DMT)-like permease
MTPKPVLAPSAIALVVLLCASWGLAQVLMKVAGEAISPLVHAGLRSTLAVPVLLAWCHWRGVVVFVRDGSLPAGLLAGALFAAEFWALYAALGLTTASRAGVLLYTAPFFAVLGAHLFVPGDRLTLRKFGGLVLAFLGLLLAFADRLGGGEQAALLGDLLALLAGLLWGATIATIKATRLTRIAPERTLLYQLAVSALLLPLGFALGERGIEGATAITWISLAYQVVGVAVASYAAWFWLVSRHPASLLAPFLFLTPVFGVSLGALLLGEPVTWALLGALVLIGAGIVVVNRA